MGTLNEDHYTILNIQLISTLLRMKNVSDQICKENRNANFMFNNFFLNRAVYEVMWKNTVLPDWPQMTIRRMRLTF